MIQNNADLGYFEKWTVQARKGVLEYVILRVLQQGEAYGYDLVRELTAFAGSGISEGTVYPLLSRLRVQGLVATRLVESVEGPARKYYALTPKGEATVALMADYWGKIENELNKLEGK